ncbi:hypothetical protein KKG05_07130 [bacterium]|nr:hypothetical protein [bacterium]
MNNRSFLVFIVIVFLLGVFLGHQLSLRRQVDTSKLLNVVGLIYNLLAVMVLSEIVTSNSKLKEISLNLVAPGVLWFHTAIPLGAFVGAMFASGSPSGPSILRFAIAFWVYSLIPLALLEATVVFPRFRALRSLESRWRYFGLFLFSSGIALQLIAAVDGL